MRTPPARTPLRSANPALNDRVFADLGRARVGEAMTVQGAVNKTALLLVLAVATAAVSWVLATATPAAPGWALGAGLAGLAVAVVTVVKRDWAPVTGPVYAVLEGVVLGVVSMVYERVYGGVVLQAVALTFATLGCLLVVYSSGLIKVTQGFRLGVAAATGAILLTYLVSLGLGLFGVRVPFVNDASPVGIAISLVIVVVAALNLVLDFDFIQHGARAGAPKYMEWYAAFGLMVTLVWLYLELLRLLGKLRER